MADQIVDTTESSSTPTVDSAKSRSFNSFLKDLGEKFHRPRPAEVQAKAEPPADKRTESEKKLSGVYLKLVQENQNLPPKLKQEITDLLNSGDPRVMLKAAWEYSRIAPIQNTADNTNVRNLAQQKLLSEMGKQTQADIKAEIDLARNGSWDELIAYRKLPQKVATPSVEVSSPPPSINVDLNKVTAEASAKLEPEPVPS
jgi:hypothetical protein